MRRARRWRVLDAQLLLTERRLEMAQKGARVLLCPQIQIYGVQLVQVLLLICLVIAWQMPCRLILDRGRVD